MINAKERSRYEKISMSIYDAVIAGLFGGMQSTRGQ